MSELLTDAAWALDLDQVLADFDRDGFARLGQVLDASAARQLAERADAMMLGEQPVPGVFYQPEPTSRRFEDVAFGAGWQGPTLRYRKLERLENDPLYAAWLGNPLFERLANESLGNDVRIYRSVLWNKRESGGMAVPWHQDDGRFWGLDRPPSLQVWTALDDAPEEAGCLEVVPGSHKGGLASPEGGTILDEALAGATAPVLLPAARGECILVHNHTWHRTGVNRSVRPRRALSVSFLSADTRCRRKRRRARTFPQAFRSPLS